MSDMGIYRQLTADLFPIISKWTMKLNCRTLRSLLNVRPCHPFCETIFKHSWRDSLEFVK
jgi:hypothetical protein